ncbi:hypothetical protein V8E52_006075 [Russula decolorans]
MFPCPSSNRLGLASGATASVDHWINYLFLKFMQRAMQHLSLELVQNIDYGVPRTSFAFKMAQELTFSMLTDFWKPEGLASIKCAISGTDRRSPIDFRKPEGLASLKCAIPWTDGRSPTDFRKPEDLASLERAIPWTDLTAFLSQGLDIEARVLSLQEQHKDDLDTRENQLDHRFFIRTLICPGRLPDDRNTADYLISETDCHVTSILDALESYLPFGPLLFSQDNPFDTLKVQMSQGNHVFGER